MDGRRYLMKAQLEKERLELERQREEEEARRRKEMAGVQESLSVDVPSPQSKPPSVTVEVPPDVLQVSVHTHQVEYAGLSDVCGTLECLMMCSHARYVPLWLEHIVCH